MKAAPSRHTPIPTLVWLCAAAGSMAVLVVAVLRHLPASYVDDGVIAINLFMGKGFTLAFHGPEGPTASHAPFQPFVLAAIHGLLGVGWMGVAGVVGVRAGAHGATAVLAYLLARRLMLAGWAAAVAAIIALHPVLFLYAGNLKYLDCRITLSLPLLMLAILACIRAREQPRYGRYLLAGAAIGLAALSEPPVLLFAVPASAIMIVPVHRGERCRALAAVVVAALLVMGPWLLRNAFVLHAITPRSSFGLLFWVGNSSDADGLWDDQEIETAKPVPVRDGALLVGQHATWFNFSARRTLPPEVSERLEQMTEIDRDRVLLPIALTTIWHHPLRFLRLTATRAFYLAGSPPHAPSPELEALVARFIPAVGPLRAAFSEAERARTFAWMELAMRTCLGFAFALALIGTIWLRTPVALLLASLLSTWLLVFGVTHCGYPDYRLTMEPFALIGVAATIVSVLGHERPMATAATGSDAVSAPRP